jgi:DNA-binding response OmpR family regulator
MLPQSILVVEDELITQRYIKNILQEYNVGNIVCFDSAKGVIENITSNSIDMVLMDINIKGNIDGIVLATEILKHTQIPIIFITAYSDDDTLDEVLEISPFGFISKPFSSKELTTTIKVAYHRFLDCQAKKQKLLKKRVDISSIYSFLLEEKQLYYKNKRIDLNSKQTLLIEILVKNINHTVSFETLEVNIWQDESITRSSLRTLVYNLRKLLPNFPIKTHSKIGYYLQQI